MHKRLDAWNLVARAVAMALTTAFATAVGLGQLRLWDLAAALAISAPSVVAGRLLGVALRVPRRPGLIFSFEIAAGYAAVGLLDLGLAELFHLNALEALVFSTIVVGGLFAWKGRLPADGAECAASSDWIDFAILPVTVVALLIWDHSTLTSLRDAQKSGIFLGWPDLMAHATQITYLRHFHVLAGQSLELAGTPQYLYHRGSYTLAAAFAELTGHESLQVATCFWQPLGLILLGLGAYGYASSIGRQAAGLFAVIALSLVPDAGMYGLRNAFFSYHWLVVVSPASGYGIALVLLSLAMYGLGVSARRLDLIFVGAILTLAAFAFKVQVAIPAALLYVVLSFFAWSPRRSWHRAFALLVIFGAAWSTVVILEHVRLAPHFLTGTHDAIHFFDYAHTQKSRYADYYLNSVYGARPAIAVLMGTGLLLAATLGALLPASLVVTGWRLRKGGDWRLEIVPHCLLVAFIAVIFLLPTTAYGDFSEYSHRPFVLVYAVMLVATAVGLYEIVEGIAGRHPAAKPATLLLGSLLVLAAGVFGWSEGQHVQLSWGNLPGLQMPPGLFAACRYIREHSNADDRVLSSDGDPKGVVLALSERPSFLSRARFFQLFKGSIGDVADQRSRLLGNLLSVGDVAALRNFGSSQGVRWFLVCPGDLPRTATPTQFGESVWSADGFQVFDLK